MSLFHKNTEEEYEEKEMYYFYNREHLYDPMADKIVMNTANEYMDIHRDNDGIPIALEDVRTGKIYDIRCDENGYAIPKMSGFYKEINVNLIGPVNTGKTMFYSDACDDKMCDYFAAYNLLLEDAVTADEILHEDHVKARRNFKMKGILPKNTQFGDAGQPYYFMAEKRGKRPVLFRFKDYSGEECNSAAMEIFDGDYYIIFVGADDLLDRNDKYTSFLTKFFQSLQAVKRHDKPIHILFAVTKADLLPEALRTQNCISYDGENGRISSVLYKEGLEKEVFDQRGETAKKLIFDTFPRLSLLAEKYQKSINASISYCMFASTGCSTIYDEASDETRINLDEYAPINITEPLMKIFADYGLIDKYYDGEEEVNSPFDQIGGWFHKVIKPGFFEEILDTIDK